MTRNQVKRSEEQDDEPMKNIMLIMNMDWKKGTH